jgi:hypothetical protein
MLKMLHVLEVHRILGWVVVSMNHLLGPLVSSSTNHQSPKTIN